MSGRSKSPSALLSASRRSSTGALEYARPRPRRSAPSTAAHRANRTPHRHRSDSRPRPLSRRSSISMDHRQFTNNAQPNLAAASNKARVNISNNADSDNRLDRVDFVAPLGERLSATRFSSSSESKLEVAKLLEAKIADNADDADAISPRRSSTGALEQALTMGAASQKSRKHHAWRRDNKLFV